MKYDPNVKLLRSKLASYLTRKTSLKGLRRWLIPASWDMAKWASRELQEFVYDIELCMIEYANGHWTEQELREQLTVLISSYKIGEQEKTTLTSSITLTLEPDFSPQRARLVSFPEKQLLSEYGRRAIFPRKPRSSASPVS